MKLSKEIYYTKKTLSCFLVCFSVSILIIFLLSDISFATVRQKITPLDSEGHLKSPSKIFTYFAEKHHLSIENYSEIRARVKKGETLAKMLNPYGVTHAEIFSAAKNSRRVFDVHKIRSGRWYSIIKERSMPEKVKYFIYEKDDENYVVFDFGDPIKVHAAQQNINIKIRQVEGVIHTTLHDACLQLNLPSQVIAQLDSIYSNKLDLKTLHRNDRIRLAYEEKYILNKFVGSGNITAAVIVTRNGNYQAYRFTHDGKTGYYDEKGNSLEKSFLKYPLKYRKITSEFSLKRLHPVTKRYRSHPGIDFSAPKGTPVKSVGDGVVVFKGYCRSAGNYIKIDHPGTGISEYLHLSRFHPTIKKGRAVSKGDIIGYVGKTGYATGPHLDLRFMVNGSYVDYRKLKLPDGTPLPEVAKQQFAKEVAMITSKWQLSSTQISMNIKDSDGKRRVLPRDESMDSAEIPSGSVIRPNPSDKSFPNGS
ncbi:peptidoglycan DD-metalloendopeptidase family protein [Desulfamplus magnetovallimortis]|uniref:peptidoglycan DD-metalloendopeptidase family protein n=1 Tax=Desulfamplus magnetovallimortis TaxID=1246637 RepID=UPI0016456297|nr:peptidoglycan DD-metalloendopeptidase family protein [Desulfamplus magnetovallimortis]